MQRRSNYAQGSTGENLMQESQDSENEDSAEKVRIPQLTAIELRVLGVLMEKQLTTPDVYPLTVNSIVAACNQKTSRDPVSNYQPGEVQRSLNELEVKKFVRKEYGSRAGKYSQQFIPSLELGKKQQALLCVMMLRGLQTPGELYSRTQRMEQFSDKDELNHCIDRLCEREVPFAIRLGAPGQRGERIAHLFSGKPLFTANASGTPHAVGSAPSSVESVNTLSTLELDVASLRDTVRSLESENITLRHQIQTLYRLTAHEIPEDTAPEQKTH